MKFASGRGHKVHGIREETLDNKQWISLCGRRLDTLQSMEFTTWEVFCGNCKRTEEFKASENRNSGS